MPAYQRILLKGVPVWKDAEGRLYYYENSTPPTHDNKVLIGTEAAGLNSDWQIVLQSYLHTYREGAASRARAVKN